MKAFWKKTAFLSAVGFIAGMLVGLTILTLSGNTGVRDQRDANRMILYLAMSGVLGMINTGTTTIYGMEKWGILRCTLTHFCISMTTMCAIGFSMGWFHPGDPTTWCILGAAVIVYFMIWLVQYLVYRRRIRQINVALKQWKASNGGE